MRRVRSIASVMRAASSVPRTSLQAGWGRYGSNLLENVNVLEQLFSNPHYLKIGPAAEMVKQMRKACNALRDCGDPFVPQGCHLAAKRAQAHGSLTVSTTYLA